MARELDVTIKVDDGGANETLVAVDASFGKLAETIETEATKAITAFEKELQQCAKEGKVTTDQLKALRAEFVEGLAEGIKKESEELRKNNGEMNKLHEVYSKFDSMLSSMGIHIGQQVKGLDELATASGKTASELGLLGTAGLAVTAAMIGWKIGEKVGEWTGLTKSISEGTASLMGWGDVAEQSAMAGGDAIALALKRTGVLAHDAAEALELNTRWLKEHNKEAKEANRLAKEAAEEFKRWQAAMVELSSAGDGWKGTLDTIDGSVVEAIKFYLQAGVSQGALATAYALTATQVKAVESALRAETAAQKEQEALLKQYAATLSEVHEIEGGRHANVMRWLKEEISAGKERFEQEMAYLQAWRAAYASEEGVKKAQFDRNAGPMSPDAAFGAATARDKQLADLERQQQAFPNIDFNASRQKIWQDFDAALMKATQGANTVAAAHTSAGGSAVTLANVFNQMQQGIGGTQAGRGGMSDEELRRAGYRDEHGYVTQQGAFFGYGYRPGSVSPFNTAGGRADGGPVSAGQSYMVGERGRPEIFTPGASGFITPTDTGGGVSVGDIHIHGNVDSELRSRQIAREVANEIMRRQKQQAHMVYGK